MDLIEELKESLVTEYTYTGYLAQVVEDMTVAGAKLPSPEEYIAELSKAVVNRGKILELLLELEDIPDNATLQESLLDFFGAVTDELPNIPEEVAARLFPVVKKLEAAVKQLVERELMP